MARLKTFADGGSLLSGDMNNIEDDYEYAFSTYKVVMRRNGAFPAASSTSQILATNAVLATAGTMTAALGDTVHYMDPAWFNVTTPNTRTTKFNVRAFCMIGGTAPATTLTVGYYPVTFNAAGAAAFNTVTLGTVTSGSTVAFASPGTNTQNQGSSGDFTAPAAGWYALGVASSGSTAASSISTIFAFLEMRQV